MTKRGDRQPARRGLTLVELLVAIGIVGLLAALLLPAVQAAREAARAAQCGNRLREIGLALLAYHEAVGSLPPGNVTGTPGICYGGAAGPAGYPTADRANWCLSLLPYLEQGALYQRYNFEEFNEAPDNRAVREAPLAAYTCPSDLPTEQLIVPASGPGCALAMNLGYRPGSYRAVSGRSDGVRYLDSAELGSFPLADRGAIHTIGVKNFTVERQRNIRDGTSNTLLIGESTTRTSPAFRTLWAYSYAHYSLSAVTPQPRILWGDYDRCKAAAGNGGSLPCRRGWGSFHPGIVQFAFCDASVRRIGLSVEMGLLASLATIEGGETELPAP